LSQRVKRRKKILPMSTAVGVYVIAHELGIPLDKHLDGQSLAEVRQTVQQLKGRPDSSTGQSARGGGRQAQRDRRLTITFPDSEAVEDPFVHAATARHCKGMAELYAYVYVFENSVRGFVAEVLRATFGDSWWERAVPREIQGKVTQRRQMHDANAWHSSPSADPLSYVDIEDLTKIIDRNSQHFAPLFKGVSDGYRWLTTKLGHIKLHRNVLMHNNPLGKENAAELKRYCKQWQRQAKGIRKQLTNSDRPS